MARVTIGVVTLLKTDGTLHAGGSLTVADGAVIAAGGKTGNLWVHVKNTGGSIGTVSVPVGSHPPALRNGLGSIDVIVPATTGERLFMVESARHAQDNGDIHLDFSAGMNGSVYAYRLPQDA